MWGTDSPVCPAHAGVPVSPLSSSKRMQIKLAPDLSLLAIVAIFILNYLVVRRFFIRPINGVIEARETETRTAEEMYEEAMTRLNDATSQMEQQLHTAKRD